MIRPTKYLDLTTSVVRVAARILEALQGRRSMPLPELDERLTAEIGERGRPNVLPALNLLFLLGRVDYDADRDVVLSLVPRSRRTA